MSLPNDIGRFVSEQEPRSLLQIPKPIDVFQAQTTAGTVFTAQSDADFRIALLRAVNTTSTADYVTLYMVPDGGTAGAGNMVCYQKAIPAKDFVDIFSVENEGLLQPAATLQVLCGVNNAINLFGHGFDYQGNFG